MQEAPVESLYAPPPKFDIEAARQHGFHTGCKVHSMGSRYVQRGDQPVSSCPSQVQQLGLSSVSHFCLIY